MRLSPKGLIGWSILVVATIVLVQLLASVAFYSVIDRQSLREDHARRIAELLVVGARVNAAEGPKAASKAMSTSYLDVTVRDEPPVIPAKVDRNAAAIAEYVRRWEPELAAGELVIWSERGARGHDDLVGAMRMGEGQWLSFRSRDFPRGWPIALRATMMTLVVGLCCLALSIYALRHLGGPLRRLTYAAQAFGRGRPTPVEIGGPADLQDLGRAFNEMQERITGLIEDQARSMDAISHDLRTPLSRLQLASEFVKPADARKIIADNVAELDLLLNSLSAYLRAQHEPSDPSQVDLAQVARSAAERFAGKVAYIGPETCVVRTHRTPLEQALIRLVDNGVRYGGGAEVELRLASGAPEIHVRDHGPGIPPQDLGRIYEPFFRVDDARARDTAGFGLGIPTAQRLLHRFGGEMEARNREGGGLDVTIWPPRP